MSSFSCSLSVLLLGELFDFILFFVFLSCITIMGDSISSKKRNGHQAYDSMSLLGILINNTFHNRNKYYLISFYLTLKGLRCFLQR